MVILDSLLLYCNNELAQLCDKKLFVVVNKEVAFYRRMMTKAAGMTNDYFEYVLWPSYLRSNAHLRNSNDIMVLNGASDPSSIHNAALAFIHGRECSERDRVAQAKTSEIPQYLHKYVANAKQFLHATPGKAKIPIAIVLSGSFNPPHTMHIRTFDIAKEYLAKTGHEVLAGLIAPSSDEYVGGKMKKKGEEHMLISLSGSFRFEALCVAVSTNFAVRNQLCEIATSDSNWVSVWPRGDASSPRTARAIEAELRLMPVPIQGGFATIKDIQVLEICGADYAMRIPLRGHNLLIIQRPPQSYQELRQKVDRENSKLAIVQANAQDISSTAIRKHFAGKESYEAMNREWLHPLVYEALGQYLQLL